MGTGLAAAIVRGGEVVRGAGGAAGEIGHLPVGSGVPCSCGQDGCLETIASGTALHRMWPGLGRRPLPAAAAPVTSRRAPSSRRWPTASPSPCRCSVVTGAELVVIGGGLARDRVELEAALAADIDSRAHASPFLRRLDLVSQDPGARR